MSPRRYAVVAGGGTGGHVLPALAVARALVARGHERSTIEFVGSRRGQEGSLLAAEGFPMLLLPGRGVSRKMGARDVLANVGALLGVAGATVTAVRSIRRWRPSVVVSIGGYASFPAGLAAVVLRIPLVLVNVDAVPGLVHRVLGPFAAASAVAFPGTPLRRSVVTGTPVREEIQQVDRAPSSVAAARRALGIPEDRPTIAVFGGSLGARRVNDAAWSLAERWEKRSDLSVYHVTGRRDWEEMSSRTSTPGRVGETTSAEGLCYRLVPFEDHMSLVYRAADLCICRAGAITVAELALAGMPAVLVPLPGAPGDHQTHNARALVDAGAAVLVADDRCEGSVLEEVVGGLFAEAGVLSAMGAAARTLARPGAADRVAEVVEVHAR